MKLVTTALEWSYEASETNVRSEALAKAAELLVLRRDTLRIIDGEGPKVEDSPESQAQTLPEHAETGEQTPSAVQDSHWVEVEGSADPFGSTVEVGRDWVWREDRIQDLLSTQDSEVLFLSGCAENMPKFFPQFDHIVLLSAPADWP